MKHYVQYHKSDERGAPPPPSGDGFAISAKKSIRHLLGQRVWLISGEGAKKKTFYFEYSFVVENVEVGSPNRATGPDGLCPTLPIKLSGLSWFEDFKDRQQNFSLGVREIDSIAVAELEKLLAHPGEPVGTPQERLTVQDYLTALSAIEGKLSVEQREMLVGHANALGHALSMGNLAALAGYDGYETANLQYGRVDEWLAEMLSISSLAQKTSALATVNDERDDAGDWRLVMRPQMVEALRQLWPELILPESDEIAAAADIDLDPLCKGLKATERAALIQARIGQGAYRRKLLDLWKGRCAVTGCEIGAVLVASHAKPWRKSSNNERLDPFNGLLLASSVDRLFDKGLITFANDGKIIADDRLTDTQLSSIGLSRQSRLSRVDTLHLPYLNAHREGVFGQS
ncbi:MAG: HNH endonuclease signature motif containing protein [Burkholderiaceae bacterium]